MSTATALWTSPTTDRTAAYDVDNRITQWTDQNGTICDMSYDGLDRLLARNVTRALGVIGSTVEVFAYERVRQRVYSSRAPPRLASQRTIEAWSSRGGGPNRHAVTLN